MDRNNDECDANTTHDVVTIGGREISLIVLRCVKKNNSRYENACYDLLKVVIGNNSRRTCRMYAYWFIKKIIHA